MMKKKMLLMLVLLVFSLFLQSASAVVINFDDVGLGSNFIVGQSFTASGVQINVKEFQPTVGPPVSGLATIGNGGIAGSTGNEVGIFGVNLEFITNFGGCPSCGISLLFGDYGGDINLGINGNVLAASNFGDLNGTVIDGATINVVQGQYLGALLIVSGEINTFTIGGQELAIDTMLACETNIPEPATMTLLGLGGFLVMRKRKNS